MFITSDTIPDNNHDLFSVAPVDPRVEMAAYESLWLGQSAWFASIAELFKENPDALPSELVPKAEYQRVQQLLIERLGSRVSEVGVRVHGTTDYPDRLREADHPLEVFYFRGDWSLAASPSVAIVGTRDPSDEGLANAGRISKALVRDGYTVVSGLAKGIDRAAHTAALEANGRTIGVIGTPLFEAYPKENADLQEKIAEEHLLISQVPFLRYKNQHYKANRLFFPARNVTMSALTLATVIVEAGETSGTLVQARAALNQGRKLFILESCFRRSDITWPAKYERQGAIRVKSVSDILDQLGKAPTNVSAQTE
ncbi:DNA processing protein DprA [Xanthomonas axonopodis pv. martyniicola]|uniref:DNA-processing protein DprA n=1 Tax=Xanthomonas axonopodis TaxID=53413 RepID=UPI000996D3C6|nr:DNA-processing protein DprA [Xanthomonas axonopodis]OOW67080.1 DNA processing protein DprA [Xanthomonas axonopodis pv. martyniicola]OOW90167.1 DNA processing protein DprA [Xanthomonas campestris pv. vitiscarnosae]